MIARLRAVPAGSGFLVETEIHPISAAPGQPPLTRPYAFPTLEHARRFAEEALMAFEYLNCSVT